MSGRIDMTGKRYNRLLAIRPLEPVKGEQLKWLFQCECGTEIALPGPLVRKGNTKSCGCLATETKRAPKSHGLCSTKSYWIWKSMMQRCYNENDSSFENYGGRGIFVVDRWHDVENFFSDMGEKPDDMSIDRIDNYGPYSPENCRWATRKEQNNNTRQNVRIKYGEEEMTVAQWAEKAGISYGLLSSRLDNGIPFPFCLLNIDFVSNPLGRRNAAKTKHKCPHCDVIGAMNVMSRYHFDNCKHRQEVAA